MEVPMRALLFILVAAMLSACATTEFKIYEAKTNVFEGTGGSKSIVDGMEIWESGSPPRKFALLGYVDDERPGGPIPMASLKSDVVKKAREAGGTAVIRLGSQSQITGFVSTGSVNSYGSSAYGTAFAAPVRRNAARFAVIKYVD
jgi:hypothetical protein